MRDGFWCVDWWCGDGKESITMKLRMGERTSGLGVRLIGMRALVLVRVLIRPVWEVYLDGTRPEEFGKNLKGSGESFF